VSDRLRSIVSWAVTASLLVVVVVALVTAPDPQVDRARAIGERIRCPVCQGESIAESPSEVARNMMALVEARLAAGRSDQQIFDELLAAYPGSLLDPPAAGATLWLWLLPPLALAVGVAAVASRVRPRPAPLPGAPAGQPPPARTRTRTVLGAAILLTTAAVTLALVGQSRQHTGVPPEATFDPATVSNETMEAVIAANRDNPQINGMRLALANRYFETGDYQRALPHYQAVLENEPDSGQAAAALARLGWMVFDGNNEVELALSLIDQALETVPGDAFALYLKGRVVWCGEGDGPAAAALFEQVLMSPGLDETVRARVWEDLTSAGSGETCM
jgi:cytochrome c-type biogenesis protein CcmH